MRSRNGANRLVQGALLCTLGVAGTVLWERVRAKPNVCLIVVDSLRADAFSSAAGSASTPNLDRLAADGVQFRKAFAHAPHALPSHASLFAARLPHEVGVVRNGQTFAGDTELLAQHLAAAGYETHGLVSLDALWAPTVGRGVEQGFEEWRQGTRPFTRAAESAAGAVQQLSEAAGSRPFFLYTHLADPHEPYDANGLLVHEADVLFDGAPLETVRTSETAFIEHEVRVPPGISLFDIRSSHPFRMRDFVAEAPEDVLVKPRPSDLENEDGDVSVVLDNRTNDVQTVRVSAWLHDLPPLPEARLRYRREVEAVDAAVGEILAELDRLGLYDDTLIVLTSDHGEALGEHGTMGHGASLYDEALRVPLFVKPPAGSALAEPLEAGRDRLARLIDVAPTMLDLLGLNPLRGATGTSLLRSEPRILMAETRSGDPERLLYALRDDRYKLVYFASENRFEMYDLAQDPTELDDVFRTQGHLRAEWQQRLKTLVRRVE